MCVWLIVTFSGAEGLVTAFDIAAAIAQAEFGLCKVTEIKEIKFISRVRIP